jgi:hypothetical protein
VAAAPKVRFAAAALATMLALAAFALAAQAKDLIGWFGTPTGNGVLAGQFNTPRGIATNSSGAGPADPGDIYVVDENNHRVQRFDSEGHFISAWGADVFGVNEQQQLNVDATGGTYTLEFEGETTAAIPEASNGAAVATALALLPAIGAGNVQGTGAANSVKTITFVEALGGTDLPLMVADSTNLTGGTATAAVTPFVDGAGGAGTGYEICTEASLCKAGLPSGGNPADNLKNGAMDNPQALAIDEDTGNVYVSDRDNRRINQYDGAGNFIRSFGWDVDGTEPGLEYEVCPAANRCKAGVAGAGIGQISTSNTAGILGVAVSPADGEAATGTVFVADSGNRRVNSYALDGSSPSSFGSATEFGTTQPRVVAVDSRGIVYASNSNNGAQVERYDSENANGGGTVFLGPLTNRQNEVQTVSFENVANGNLFTLTCPNGETTAPFQWDANNTVLWANMQAVLVAKCGGSYIFNGPATASNVQFSGDFEGTNVPKMTCTVVSGNGVCEITAETNGIPGALLPATSATATGGLAVDPDLDEGGPEEDILYVLRDPQTGPTRVLQLGPLNDPGLTAPPLDDDEQHAGSANFAEVLALGLNPASGTLYLSATNNIKGTGAGNRVYIIDDPPLQPIAEIDSITGVTSKSAKISATINPKISPTIPNPPNSTARLEFKLTTESQWTQYGPNVDVGSEDADTNTSITLGGLIPNRQYEVRYTVTTQYGGVTDGTPETFTTLTAPPAIEGFFATNVQKTTADLVAVINPLGLETTYWFEYGTTPNYGKTAPIPNGELAASPDPQKVVVPIEGLEGVTYHFRVKAESEAGDTTTADQTFTFYPPICPNSHLRQQTGSAHLPDCRAYELVSHPNAGSTILLFDGPTSPTATNPSRFGYSGFLGLLPDTGDPMGVFGDSYIATRTTTGWVTRYVGLRGNEGALAGGPPNGGGIGAVGPAGVFVNEDMSELIDWNDGTQGYVCCGELGSFSPYLWDSTGEFLGRLPSNIHEIPNGLADWSEGAFFGDVQPSPDFSHYFFSSNNVAFTEDGLTSAPGSAYSNDLSTGEVTLISKTPNGHLPTDASDPEEYVEFPGIRGAVSNDGSHIVMSTRATGGMTHLWMSVNSAITYDLSLGQDGLNHPAKFEGMTPDGETVYLTSMDQLTPDDEDASKDLYMWTEKPTPTLTRISKGTEGTGNDDACSATWVAGCGAEVVDWFTTHKSGLSGETTFPTDNAIAASNGDVYFYSPELFDNGQGTFGARNLYVFRNGAPQYVATFLENRLVNRIQVSPDDAHAAFLTAEQLTAYDNAGRMEMYHYSPATGEIQCVSCIPDGSAPNSDVEASQNGLFMTDDGRTFFSTRDALVEKDVNGLWDTYEFVENRPQLISTGTADRDEGLAGHVGLIGVSANGLDVYFSTLDTMVEQDKNGPFYKFYNARTNGGFPFTPPVPGCAAADECHGPDSEAPAPAQAGTRADLGQGGNVRFDACAGLARRAKRDSSRAKSLRAKAGRLAGSSEAGAEKRAAQLQKRANRLAKRGKQAQRKAKRCRQRRRGTGANGGAGR